MNEYGDNRDNVERDMRLMSEQLSSTQVLLALLTAMVNECNAVPFIRLRQYAMRWPGLWQ